MFFRLLDRDRDQRGMGLLDVLLGMAIFALVITIGAQNFNTMRERTYVTRAVADVKQVATGIDAIRTKDDAYPATVARNASNLPGINLTRGSTITGYWPTTTSFKVCLAQSVNSQKKAWAVYESDKGTITGSGRGSGPGECDGVTGIDPTSVGPTDPNTPINVRVTAVPGETRATVEWDAVTGASAYAVYLDGANSPAWTGPALNTVLTGLSFGDHSVAVTATVAGSTSEPSPAAPFKILGDNDFIRYAHPITLGSPGTPAFTKDYTNAAATRETGELTGQLSMWWSITATKSTSFRVDVAQDSSGAALFTYPQIKVWEGEYSDVTALPATVYADNSGGGGLTPTARFTVTAGRTYMVRISAGSTSYKSPFRLRATTGPANDMLADAIPVGLPDPEQTWTSPDTSNVYADAEAGEDSERDGSMWWTMTAPRTGTYRFEVLQASDGSTLYTYPQIAVWKSSSTDPATMPLASAISSNYLDPFTFFSAVEGQTYKIRVSTASSWSNSYRTAFRVRLTAGPANDSLNAAWPVAQPAAGVVWTSNDFDNTLAGPEENETEGHGGMWWTMTATRTGTLVFEVVAPSTGGSYFTYPKVRAWNTTTSDVTALGAEYANNRGGGGLTPRMTMSVTAGQTYRIKVASEAQGNPMTSNYRSKFRIKVTG